MWGDRTEQWIVGRVLRIGERILVGALMWLVIGLGFAAQAIANFLKGLLA